MTGKPCIDAPAWFSGSLLLSVIVVGDVYASMKLSKEDPNVA